jgi:hypothetical protein
MSAYQKRPTLADVSNRLEINEQQVKFVIMIKSL